MALFLKMYKSFSINTLLLKIADHHLIMQGCHKTSGCKKCNICKCKISWSTVKWGMPVQGNTHNTISWFLYRNFSDQKGTACYFQSAEREKKQLSIKNILPGKIIVQTWRRNEEVSRETNAKFIHTNWPYKRCWKGKQKNL